MDNDQLQSPANYSNVQAGNIDSQTNLGPSLTEKTTSKTVYSGISGNEFYCLYLCNFKPGNLLVGNSVYSMGFLGSLLSGVRTTIGGEISQITNMISEGRRLSFDRLQNEMNQLQAHGVTGVSSELIFHPANIEFLSVGSSIYSQGNVPAKPISSSSDGQEFFCQVDAGYIPMQFVFGNVAYSIGIGRNIIGQLKELRKGEISQYSNIFNTTRNMALERISGEAKKIGANSVIGIRTTILPIGENGVQEMVMIGTASFNDKLTDIANQVGGVLTSDFTAEETWNVTRLGYVPLKLILGTSVYALGVAGGIKAAIRGFIKGEISALTQMIYGAREESLKKVQQQAEAINADDVLGIKTYIYQLGGDVIEFLAIGTAVKKMPAISTRSDQLPPQAIIRDKTTFINAAETSFQTNLNKTSVDSPNQTAS